MSTSFISHKSRDGSRAFAVLSLNVLHSITPEQVNALHQIGIHSLSDLLHYDPIHRARLVEAVAKHRIAHDFDLTTVVRNTTADRSPEALLRESTEVIDGIGDGTAVLLQDKFGVATVEELANFSAFVEAEVLLHHQAESFSEPASAPDELIPLQIGAVASTHRFNSFVRDRWISLGGLVIRERFQGASDPRLTAAFLLLEKRELAVGYMLRQTQQWTNLGSHLGEVVHSLGLAPGESRNVAIVDWKRSLLARRDESTTVREELNSLLVHTRALDEVARAVAEEHQSGRTSTASATGVTAASAVATGSLIGSIAGGIVGGTTGLIPDIAVAGLDLGAFTISGTVLGSAVGGLAGAFAGNLIFSGVAALGYIESDTTGNRRVGGDLGQNIIDTTAQKASAIRSLRSTIVVEDNQSEQAIATTFNVTNYNHAHALTIQYYELLQRYSVRLTADAVEPFLIIPFRPLNFTIDLVTDYWNVFRFGIPEPIRQPIDEMVNETGLISLPKRPISDDPEAILSFVQVELISPVSGVGVIPSFRIVHNGIGGGNNDPELEELKTGVGLFIAQKLDLDLSIADVHGIRVRGSGIDLGNTMTLTVRQAEIRVGNNTVILPPKELGEYKILGGAGNLDHVFVWEPKAILQEMEQTVLEQFVKVNRLMQYIRQRNYFFTRLLLAGIEAEQLSDILERLVLQSDEEDLGVPLSDLIETIPIGFTSEGIVCRFRHDTRLINVFNVSQNARLRRGSSSPAKSAADSSMKPILIKSDSPKGQEFLNRVEELVSFPEEIFGWFNKVRADLTRTREISLPTSGLFTEAILGRSNAAEKIDLTRFINWQDMPIPNASPAILPADTGSRVQDTPPLTVTNTEGVLNILPPTPLPDPTGLTNVLAAVQNGNIFRDMSQAALLGSILTNLSGVAERTAAASAQLSGDELAASLQAATQLANKVADGVQSLAGDAFKSMTQLGGELNTPVPTQPTPTPVPTPVTVPPTPTPVPPTPSPVPPAPTPSTPQQKVEFVEAKLRIFIPKPAELVIPVTLLGSEGLMAFSGDNRGFGYEAGTSRLDLSISFQVDTETMQLIDSPRVTSIPGIAAAFDIGGFERVQPAGEEVVPPWVGKAKAGTNPVRIATLSPSPEQVRATAAQLRPDEITVNFRVSANLMSPPFSLPSLPGSDDLESVLDFISETVDADIFITLTREAGGRLKFMITGNHDGFPAYEIYVNKLMSYFWDPIAEGTDNRDMRDFIGESIEMNNSLLVPKFT
jgi:hypothetical protein